MAQETQTVGIQRKVLQTVVVYRGQDRITPKIGSIFEFSQTEYDWLNKNSPEALGKPTMEVDSVAHHAAMAVSDDERLQIASDARRQLLAEIEAENAANLKAQQSAGKAGKNKSDDDI